jgi:hypothetical protein
MEGSTRHPQSAATSVFHDRTRGVHKAGRRRKKRGTRQPSTRRKAFWGVFDNMGNRVACFEYSQREAVEKKAAELSQRNAHFVSVVKEDLPDAA